MRIFQWIGAALRLPGRFGCAVLLGLYAFFTMAGWSYVASMLSAAHTPTNIAGALALVFWLAATGAVVRGLVEVFKPTTKESKKIR